MVARASRWTACGSGPCRGHAPWLLDPEEVVVAAEGAATGALFARDCYESGVLGVSVALGHQRLVRVEL